VGYLEETLAPLLGAGEALGRAVAAREADRAALERGLREHLRVMGRPPSRHEAAAWLYRCRPGGDRDAAAAAFLYDCRGLGFDLGEAEGRVVPLIRGSGDLLNSTSAVSDMALSPYGQPRVGYLRMARALAREWGGLGSRGWEMGRTLALILLACREPAYHEPRFEAALGAATRANARAELLLLGFDWEKEKRGGADEVQAQRPDTADAGAAGGTAGPVPGGGEGGGEVRLPPGGAA
jgi:hypothetical protein